MTNNYGCTGSQTVDPEAELLEDLELSCRSDAASARQLASSRRKVSIAVRAANVVDRTAVLASGHTTELHRHGALCLVTQPVMVGSLFHLTFDRTQVELGPTLAACDRCAMLSDCLFELRFTFVQEVDLPVAGFATQDS